MENRSGEPGPVAVWARVLAWLFVAANSFVIVSGSIALLEGRPLPAIPWYKAAPFVVAAVWLGPLLWIVAIAGRPPKSWPGFGKQLWQSQDPARK
jgi:predicted small integral membrane protein